MSHLFWPGCATILEEFGWENKLMKGSLKTGISFGLTSGVITTLGLIVGLHAGTHSQKVVIGGILTIAIADAFSDALGIHIAEESEDRHSFKEVWLSTFWTFLAKFIFAASFVIPFLLLSLPGAVKASVVYGLILLASFSLYLSRGQGGWKPAKVVAEHLVIAIFVVVVTHYLGRWLGAVFY